MKGLTGTIKFDQHGLRSDFALEIVELKKGGLIKVGEWLEKTGVTFSRNFTESYNEILDNIKNKTLIVTTVFVSSAAIYIPIYIYIYIKFQYSMVKRNNFLNKLLIDV